jgi:predicted  nucleic acid-binding Zn-ribbon protein
MSETSPAATLAALQQLDVELERAEHEIVAFTAGLTDERAVRAAKARADAAQQALRQAQGALREAENDLSDTEQRIARNEQRLMSGVLTAARDITATENELAFLRKTRGERDERVLLAMEAAEIAQQRANDTAQTLAQTERDRTAELAHQRAGLADAQQRQQTLAPQRAAAADMIDPTLLARYEGIRKTRGRAVATVINGTCQGCRVVLPAPTVQRLRTAPNEIITCGNCGRILLLG